MADPGGVMEFATETYHAKQEHDADEYAAEGLTELELTAQYCRSCTVSVQRLFHVRTLGAVCKAAMVEGDEAFPLDLVEDLAQDDDSEVRQMVAEQLCVMAEAVRETRSRQEEDIASGLLSVAFLLVEDDVDAVVTAAEAAVATVASLLEDTQEGHELVMTQIANLATGEEEEIRVSGAKIVGSLASVLWPTAAKNDLTPLLEKLAQDSAYHVREVTIHSLVLVAEVRRCRLTPG